MLRAIIAALALSVGIAVVWAQNEAMIVKRQKTMKSFSAAAKAPLAMLRDDAPFDPAVVRAALRSIQQTAAAAKTVFPDDSRGGSTATLPAAFDNRADLFARFDKLAADAKAADGIKDEATFKAQWPALMLLCTSCHRLYVEAR
jgi:cytochrome c556